MITIVNSGGANIASIQFCLERLGIRAELSHDVEIIKNSSHIILPGVGAAVTTMKRLQLYSLVDALRSLTQPVLGICLGMQILFDYSEEGSIECLGLIPGKVMKFKENTGLTVPHMGWNTFEKIKDCKLLNNVPDNAYSYFVHSYFAPVTEYTSAMTTYGGSFASVVQYKNYFGTQFHPERSSDIGKIILKNFLEL